MTKPRPIDDDVRAFEKGDFDLTKLRPAKVRIAKEPKNSLAVRFDVGDLERLRQRAEAEGVGVTQLVRAWVLERLDEPAPAGAMQALLDALDQGVRAAKVIKRSTSRKAS